MKKYQAWVHKSHKYQPRTGHTREPDPKHLEQNTPHSQSTCPDATSGIKVRSIGTPCDPYSLVGAMPCCLPPTGAVTGQVTHTCGTESCTLYVVRMFSPALLSQPHSPVGHPPHPAYPAPLSLKYQPLAPPSADQRRAEAEWRRPRRYPHRRRLQVADQDQHGRPARRCARHPAL